MRLFVFEEICATQDPATAPASLQREGRAMLEAVLADLAAIPGTRLITVLHPQQPPLATPAVETWRGAGTSSLPLERAARTADGCLIVAPETDGVLLERARQVLAAGGQLLGPGLESIRLFSDKLATADLLGPLGIATMQPPSVPAAATEVVVKPRDGAGASFTAAGPANRSGAIVAGIASTGGAGSLVVQPFHAGVPASIAVIVAAGFAAVLPAVEQVIERTPWPADPSCVWMTYAGGRLPMAPALNERALRLACRFLDSAAGLDLAGYCGLDLVLGADPAGGDDRIVEVNPRLTTSYVGYRKLLPGSLGRLMLGWGVTADPLPHCGGVPETGAVDPIPHKGGGDEILGGRDGGLATRQLPPIAGKPVVVLVSTAAPLRFFPDGTVETTAEGS